MSDFQLDLKKIKKVQPENAKAGYLYFRLETEDTAADSPVLTLGVEKSGLLRAASPACTSCWTSRPTASTPSSPAP